MTSAIMQEAKALTPIVSNTGTPRNKQQHFFIFHTHQVIIFVPQLGD